ncbi:MAG TPA: protein disulfide oxidoreductase [Myxococcales bacterium]|jgi:thiol-disulfide isomerase/thioredoxin
MSPRKKKWLRNGVEAALFLVALLGVRAWQHRDAPSGPAPAVAGTLVSNGAPASLAALRGRPVMVHFWATWCSVCNAERGNVAAVAKDYAVLGIAEDSGGAEKVRAWMSENGAEFPTVLDDGEIARAFGVKAFPTSFFVGKDGEIRFVETGYTTELGMRLRLALAGR